MASAARGRAHRVSVQQRFHRLAKRRFGRTAVMRLDLKPVEDGRIMAGGDHDAARRLLSLDSKGNRRSRRGTTAQHHLEPVSRQNFRHPPPKLIGQKPAVVADDDLFSVPGTGEPFQKSAAAWLTRSTLWKVKSSAITARQPSVPNLMLMPGSRVGLRRGPGQFPHFGHRVFKLRRRKRQVPLMKVSAPARAHWPTVSKIHPAVHGDPVFKPRSRRQAAACWIFGSVSVMNDCPPKPGLTVMISSESTPPETARPPASPSAD